MERLVKDLPNSGWQEYQNDETLDEKMKKQKGEVADVYVGKQLVYPKLRRTDIAIETLKYYDLSWEHDRVDTDFIIILQELSERETGILFEHTRRFRSRTPSTIEKKGREAGDRGCGRVLSNRGIAFEICRHGMKYCEGELHGFLGQY